MENLAIVLLSLFHSHSRHFSIFHQVNCFHTDAPVSRCFQSKIWAYCTGYPIFKERDRIQSSLKPCRNLTYQSISQKEDTPSTIANQTRKMMCAKTLSCVHNYRS